MNPYFKALTTTGTLAKARRNPYPNEHAARLMDPKAFQPGSFRRVNKANGTIGLILGKLGGSMVLQAIRFRALAWPLPKVRAWLKSHGYTWAKVEPATVRSKAKLFRAEAARAKRQRKTPRRKRRTA